MCDYKAIKSVFSYVKAFAQREYVNTILMHFWSHSKIVGFLGGKNYVPISRYDATLSGTYDTQKWKEQTFVFNLRRSLSFQTMILRSPSRLIFCQMIYLWVQLVHLSFRFGINFTQIMQSFAFDWKRCRVDNFNSHDKYLKAVISGIKPLKCVPLRRTSNSTINNLSLGFRICIVDILSCLMFTTNCNQSMAIYCLKVVLKWISRVVNVGTSSKMCQWKCIPHPGTLQIAPNTKKKKRVNKGWFQGLL